MRIQRPGSRSWELDTFASSLCAGRGAGKLGGVRESTRALIEDAGTEPGFSPTSSQDSSPIEPASSSLKYHLRQAEADPMSASKSKPDRSGQLSP